MFSYLLIGGHFSDDTAECRPSGYIRKLFHTMKLINPSGDIYNGGQFKDLENILYHTLPYDVILWMPDIPNDKPKLVRKIKKQNPKIILVTSKNNKDRRYSFMELVARALQVKANLFVEFQRGGGEQITASVCDPLGNQYVFSENVDEIATALICRLRDLCAFTRVGSSVVYSKEKVTPQDNEELRSFLGLVKKHAETFHELIHPVDNSRLLGNASFRCEYGFPSFKKNDQVFISKRNVDKRDIGVEAFVPVNLYYGEDPKVFYHGEDKPSVDSPIQLMLYNYYPNIRYMLHSHVYITGAPITSRRIPCGAIEEFFEIIQQFPMRDIDNLSLNLLGHGSLVMAKDISYLENIDYKARAMPETSEPQVEICPTCQGDGIARDGGYPYNGKCGRCGGPGKLRHF